MPVSVCEIFHKLSKHQRLIFLLEPTGRLCGFASSFSFIFSLTSSLAAINVFNLVSYIGILALRVIRFAQKLKNLLLLTNFFEIVSLVLWREVITHIIVSNSVSLSLHIFIQKHIMFPNGWSSTSWSSTIKLSKSM